VTERPRVLVVDDNRLAHHATLLSLRVAGYPAIAVSTPQQALDAIELFSPRIVLLEWAFRDEQHRRAPIARHLQEAAREWRLPLSIIVVSHLEPGLELADLGDIALYLVKPVAFDVVEAAMEHVLSSEMCDAVRPPVRDSRA
jgi:DNA-binding response OmpR family regulator